MATLETPLVDLRDHVTGEEILGIDFPVVIVPRAGERIHYWQDGTPDAAGTDSGIRRGFLVMRVEHDWRYMPARSGGGSARYVPSVILYVQEQKPAAQQDEDKPFPPVNQIIEQAMAAATMLDDWANENETAFTGWGEGEVPPGATFMRVKAGQALKALKEIVIYRSKMPRR